MLFQLLILQLSFLHGSIGVRVGHEVGRTSMDSTHYDRRLVQQPCPSDRFQPQVQTALFWTTSGSTKNTSLISLSNPLIDIREDDSLVTRASGAIDVNIDNPLGIDEALVNIDVDKQVRSNTSIRSRLHPFHVLDHRCSIRLHTHHRMHRLSLPTARSRLIARQIAQFNIEHELRLSSPCGMANH